MGGREFNPRLRQYSRMSVHLHFVKKRNSSPRHKNGKRGKVKRAKLGPRQNETRQSGTRQTDERQSETRQTGMTRLLVG